MKNLTMVVLLAFMLNGCVAEFMYDGVTEVYSKGKRIIILNSDLLSKKEITKLKRLDAAVTAVTTGEIILDAGISDDLDILNRVLEAKKVIEE